MKNLTCGIFCIILIKNNVFNIKQVKICLLYSQFVKKIDNSNVIGPAVPVKMLQNECKMCLLFQSMITQNFPDHRDVKLALTHVFGYYFNEKHISMRSYKLLSCTYCIKVIKKGSQAPQSVILVHIWGILLWVT